MTTEQTMVEKVARAIYAARAARLVPPYWKYDPPLPWEAENEEFRGNVREEARAAIEAYLDAIRTPLPTENSKHDEPMSAQERALFKDYASQIEARRQKLKPSTD